MKQIYQVTHVELQNLQPKSDVYLRVKMDISGRQSVWSHWVNVSMPPPCEFAKSLMRKLYIINYYYYCYYYYYCCYYCCYYYVLV